MALLILPVRFHGIAPFLARLLGRLFLLLFLWQLASTFWHFTFLMDDRPLVLPREMEAGKLSPESLSRWYGAETGEREILPENLSLIAVISGTRGAALFKKNDGTSIATRVGGEIAPGLRLIDVETKQATIARDGIRQILKLPGTETEPGRVARSISADSKTAALPQVTKTVVVRRSQLLSTIQVRAADAWDKGLSDFRESGIRIDDPSAQPFAALLELQRGDVLKSINGQILTRIADISLIAHHFGQQAQVDVSLVRNGKLHNYRDQIQP